jgi:hypothetical protein
MTATEQTTLSGVLQVRLRTLVWAIIFLGLVFAVVVQTARRQQTEARLRADLALAQAQADANLQHARVAVDQYLTNATDQMNDGGESSKDMQRDSLERTLKFYESAESNESTPEARAKARERARQIRSQLDGEPQ